MLISRQSFTLFLFFCLLISKVVYAGSLQAHLNKPSINTAESVELTLTLESNKQTAAEPDLTELKKHFYVYGINKGSQIRIINGVASSQQQWLITLVPKKTGQLTIPAITIDNQTTQSLPLAVKKNVTQDPNLFIQIRLSPKKTYMQSQMLYTVKLFYDMNLIQGQLTNPESNDLIITRFGDDQNYTANYRGKSYRVIERHYALFAKNSGNIDVKPPLFVGQALNSMTNQADTVQTVAPELTLTILPKPANYTAKTWLPSTDLSLSETWSDQLDTIKAGDAITRTIILKANGLSAEQLPKITLMPTTGMNSYPDQPTLTNTLQGNTIMGERSQTIAYIPTQEGQLQIPAQHITWFDIKSKTIKTASLPGRTLTILPNPSVQSSMVNQNPIVKPTTHHISPWPWIAGFMTCLWLATLFAWFKTRKPKCDKATTFDVTSTITQLKIAYKNKDYHQLRQLLLTLANGLLPQQSILSLTKLRSLLQNPKIHNTLNTLEKQCFHKEDNSPLDWKSIKAIVDALKQVAKSTSKTRQEKKPLLPDLYRI